MQLRRFGCRTTCFVLVCFLLPLSAGQAKSTDENRNLYAALRSPRQVAVVAFSPDGKVLATASGSAFRLWNFTTQREIGSFRFPSSGAAIEHLAFSPDGALLAAAPVGKGVGLWNLKLMRSVATLNTGSDDDPQMVFSPNGKLVATFGWSQSVQVWDVAADTVRFTLPAKDVLSAWFLSDANTLATASNDSESVEFWDLTTARSKVKWPFPRFGLPVHMQYAFAGDLLILSPDGRRLALLNNKGLSIWDVQTATRLASENGSFTNQRFSPDGKLIAAITDEGVTKVWDSAGGVERLTSTGNYNGQDGSLAFSPDSLYLATPSEKGVDIWRIPSK